MSFEFEPSSQNQEPKSKYIESENNYDIKTKQAQAEEIFNMFNEAGVNLTSQAKEIINKATLDGYVSSDDLEELLKIIEESDSDDSNFDDDVDQSNE
jgi:hypothetical protein